MNIERVVLQPGDVPEGLTLMGDVSGAVPADQLYPGAAHGVRAVFIGDPWVLTSFVTHFADEEAAGESIAGYARAFGATAPDPQPIPFLSDLAANAAGGVSTGDPDDEIAGALAMMAWSQGAVRCDLSLSGLSPEVTPTNFWLYEPARDLAAMARTMAERAQAVQAL